MEDLIVETDRFDSVAIVGVGLIGGSIGLSLKSKSDSMAVMGWDISDSVLDVAVNIRAIDNRLSTFSDVVSISDLVVIAAPVSETLSILENLIPYLKLNAVVTDTGSTKYRIVNAADKMLPGRFVGGHPMAGSETASIQGSRSNLFEGANWLITPTANSRPYAIARVAELIRMCGAKPRICDVKLHDQMVGALSHLPHLMAWELAQSAHHLVSSEWRDIAAGSFKDGTRVGRSSAAHWARILLDNRSELLVALDVADTWRTRARKLIENNDLPGLTELLSSASAKLTEFPVK